MVEPLPIGDPAQFDADLAAVVQHHRERLQIIGIPVQRLGLAQVRQRLRQLAVDLLDHGEVVQRPGHEVPVPQGAIDPQRVLAVHLRLVVALEPEQHAAHVDLRHRQPGGVTGLHRHPVGLVVVRERGVELAGSRVRHP